MHSTGRFIISKKKIIFLFLFLPVFFLLWANYSVYSESKAFLTSDSGKVPHSNVEVVLGTSRYLANKLLNTYFFNQIEAAVKLYKRGKIDFILVSGDNRIVSYNEPEDMRDELVSRGIPVSKK
jgi:SanA protein